ncbi:protein VASCULATURE COMPLEXITY AND CONNECTIVITY [Andrographis paniculata]|uniref:protein VASCULATURE COMPLEXITY AND CONNECTIVITY n=1 Tax=Andrographis paniculata TaxID=175694 RepID=UPI0021E7A630|nr:protein VASCULATURE COMPLEXITY AND CONNECTIVITY [Andrographis paniculata]
MERKAIIVCCAVGFLGLLSAATGFAAEATRVKGNQVEYPSTMECIYPRSPAMALGLTAAVALIVAQAIINITTGCVCCRKGPHQSNSNWTLALVCFVVSWFTCIIAFLLLLTGAALNDQHGDESLYLGGYYCYVVKPGVFAGAAILSLASVSLGLIYYLIMTGEKNRANPWPAAPFPSPPQANIAMGQPQFPPQNPQGHPAQGPVFVHEDTYMRRQLA